MLAARCNSEGRSFSSMRSSRRSWSASSAAVKLGSAPKIRSANAEVRHAAVRRGQLAPRAQSVELRAEPQRGVHTLTRVDRRAAGDEKRVVRLLRVLDAETPLAAQRVDLPVLPRIVAVRPEHPPVEQPDAGLALAALPQRS
jgi:hypothetical protein